MEENSTKVDINWDSTAERKNSQIINNSDKKLETCVIKI